MPKRRPCSRRSIFLSPIEFLENRRSPGRAGRRRVPEDLNRMAKTSQVNRNKMREKMAKRDKSKRQVLKDVLMDKTLPVEDRFNASLKLAQLPRNGAAGRVRLRCELTGRSRGNYRKFKLCRIALRDLASAGQIPGMVKASW